MSLLNNQVSKGRPGDALADTGDEGRGMLRKAPGRRKHPLIRRCPNGETHLRALYFQSSLFGLGCNYKVHIQGIFYLNT